MGDFIELNGVRYVCVDRVTTYDLRAGDRVSFRKDRTRKGTVVWDMYHGNTELCGVRLDVSRSLGGHVCRKLDLVLLDETRVDLGD